MEVLALVPRPPSAVGRSVEVVVPQAELERVLVELQQLKEIVARQAAAQEEQYVSIKRAAQITTLSESHVRRAVVSGRLRASNKGTELRPIWRIARSDLEAWMEQGRGGGKVPPRGELKKLIGRHLPGLRG